MQAILECFALNLHSECGKFLGLNRAVQAQLHGNLHHEAAKHERGVRSLTRGRQRPGA